MVNFATCSLPIADVARWVDSETVTQENTWGVNYTTVAKKTLGIMSLKSNYFQAFSNKKNKNKKIIKNSYKIRIIIPFKKVFSFGIRQHGA